MSKKTVAKKGVTLMELLVVLALLSIVSLSLFTIFRTATESYSKGDARTQAYQNARAALEQISREIQGALINSNAIVPGTGADSPSFYGFSEGSTNYSANSGGAEIFFITSLKGAGDMDICEVGYWLDTNDWTLMRHYEVTDKTNLPPLDFSIGTNYCSAELALHIVDLDFSYMYWDGASWAETNEWDSTDNLVTNYYKDVTIEKDPDGLPEAVKVTIVSTDEKTIKKMEAGGEIKETNTFSAVVYLPNAK